MGNKLARDRIDLLFKKFSDEYQWQLALSDLADDRVSVTVDHGASVRDGAPPIAGARLFSLIDMVSGLALWKYAKDGGEIFTATMNWHCFRPMFGQTSQIVCTVNSAHGNVVAVGGEILNGDTQIKSCAYINASVYVKSFRKRIEGHR